MRNVKKILVAMFLALAVMLSGCVDEGGSAKRSNVSFADTYKQGDTWTVYWYLCGTDLETQYGAATSDVMELLKVKLPPNVKVIIEAGGTKVWQNNAFRNNSVNRYLYDGDGLHEIGQLPDADMGNPETLSEFLRFGKENYAADHSVFVFWDHGGGSANGVCFDERTGNSLKLNDINDAFAAVYEAAPDNPPFELVGFDACLMASYDTAASLYGYTRYMTGSEEVEPGNGWQYTSWVGALAENSAVGGAKLGKIICDSYLDDCIATGTDKAATLSVVDMNKLPALKAAYETFGVDALRKAADNPNAFFSIFSRKARTAENYGGNTREQGFANMVDISDLAKESAELLPNSAEKLINAVNDAVIYRVQGAYRADGGGLSGFYTYNGDEDNLLLYVSQKSVPTAYKYLYYYLVYGEKLPGMEDLIANAAPQETAPIVPPSATKHKLFDVSTLEDLPVAVDGEGNAVITLSEQQREMLTAVHCNLVYMDFEHDVLLYLGSDTDIKADWNTGVFKDNFQATWPMLDGHPVYVEITDENEDYNIYSVPILLNGEKYNLQIAYIYADNQYRILGARKEIGANGMADRNLRQLKVGDKITTIHYAMSISGNDSEFSPYTVDTFTVGEKTHFADEQIDEGEYAYCFEFVSPTGDSATSAMVNFSVKDGKIMTSAE